MEDGFTLHVVRSGTGPPLVLLHGFTGSAGIWDNLRAPLSEGFSTFAIDLPGHGRSGTPADPERLALSRFANDLRDVLDLLGIGRVALLGYSLGGRAALGFALKHTSRVAALILESTSPGMADPGERAARVASDMALADTIEREGVPAFVDRWERLPLWASQATTLSPEERASLRSQRMANHALGLANSLRGAGAGADLPVTDRLGELELPVLLIAGAMDQKYVALSRAMETAMGDARLAIVNGAGHIVHAEQPEEFRKLVSLFLDDVRSRRDPWS
jgi:2-succinyl-6-hydroxy-2,4-cyclohexadiene-1-carboxylate synthase